MIYFVQAGEGGPIKIGFTATNVSRRIANLRTGCPHELIPLGVIDGGKDDERALHERFGADRVSGEWFSPCPMLLSMVASATPVEKTRKRRNRAIGSSGAHLDTWMIETGTTDAELGKAIGTDRSTISRYRSGKHMPTPALMRALHAITGGQVTANDFVHGDEAAVPSICDSAA